MAANNKFPTTCQAPKACLTAAAIWLAGVAGARAAPADVTLNLSVAEVVAIVSSMDRQPISQTPPDGFWDAQAKILDALRANPEAWQKVRAAMERREQLDHQPRR